MTSLNSYQTAAGAEFVGPAAGAHDHWSLPTLLEVVRLRAARQPDDVAFTFLLDGERQTADLTYGGLHRRAAAVADELLGRAKPGSRALVVLEPGLDYIAALVGCFYAGIVPAPVYPPDPFRIARTLPRLQAIFGSAECELLISTAEILGGPDGALRRTCPLGAVEIETIADAMTDANGPRAAAPDQLALLQYTSGTTGEPRGVPITHGNLIENLRGMERLLDVDNAVAVQWLPPYHDLGLIGGVFLPLFAGRRMVLMSPLSFMQSPARWLRAMSDYKATSSAAPNFGFELCLRKIKEAECEGLDLSNWQIAVSGAEPVRADTLDRFCERFAPYGFRREALMPAYGMAETTLMVSISNQGVPPREKRIDAEALSRSEVVESTDGRRIVGCGPAGPSVEVRVVDPETSRETTGVGEVWVRSPSVADGYWRRPELSEELFNQTIAGTRESGFLRTGDLGFLDPKDNELYLVGRRKEMIILAGRNFYPQDIELAVQSADEALKTDGGAATTVEVDNAERLVLFQEVQRPKRQDLDGLLTTARRVVAEETGQEPHRVVLLPVGELPKTSSGKTRRAESWELYESGSLTVLAEWPAAGQACEAEAPEFEEPASEAEKWLAETWSAVLGGDDSIGRADNFFALGGRSLQVTQMLTAVADRTGLVLPLKTLFDHPTLAALAAEIDRREDSSSATLPTQSAGKPIDIYKPRPLSASQQRFWMIEQLGAPGAANVPVALRLGGRLEVEALEAALAKLVDRHAALRTSFTSEGAGAMQQCLPCEAPAVESWSEAETGDDLLDRLLGAEWVWRPFDLARPPLLRAALVDVAGGEQVLLLVVHHLVADGGSLNVLLAELATLLAGGDLPDLPAPVSSPSTGDLSDEAYWKHRLADVPASLDLPLDHAAGNEIVITPQGFDESLHQSIVALAQRLHATPFLIYLTVYQLVLSRYANQSKVGVGVATAVRGGLVGDDAVGCFINTVPLFVEFAEGRFEEVLRRLQGDMLADLDHSQLPWEAIVAAADKPRLPGRMPLVQAFFTHDDQRPGGDQLGDVRALDAATDYRGLGVFDLSLVVESARPRPRVKLVHDRQKFAPELAAGFLRAYTETLAAVAASPASDIATAPIPATPESDRLRGGELPTHYPNLPFNSVDELVAKQIAKTPATTAVVCGDRTIAFLELSERAERIARSLVARGVGVGDRVGLLLKRTIDLPAAILGVWRAGAAYVPLDPEYPPARLEFMAEDAGLACLVADETLIESSPLPVERTVSLDDLLTGADADLPANLNGDRLAYVMYTSGSTGRPKGVMLPHRAVANLLHSFATDTGLTAGDRMLGSTTFAFDISVLELFLPLVTGATLLLADSDTAGDAGRLRQLIETSRVNYLQGAPSTFRMLLSAGWRPTGEQTILCGGEEVTPDLAKKLVDGADRVWNVYGPTETTIWSTYHPIDDTTRAIPIGRPIAGTRCYVIDDQQRLCPTGVWGQLAIAGAGVADGYWRRPELTAERFPADPFHAGGRMYLTGDAARWAPGRGGELVLQFGGRSDGQVKVRGHRVELREIEIALNDHHAVGESAVVATGAGSGEASLVAYVAPANGKPWTPAELREHLGRRLPSYMTPSAFIALDKMPRTDNGKIDRKRLPDAGGEVARSAPIVPPRTPLEEKLAGWVRELLRIERVGVYDNFFELGGQSLLATQLVVRMRDELGVEPPLRDVYERPTIADWAGLILKTEIDAGGSVTAELLDQLESMTDEAALELLKEFPAQG